MSKLINGVAIATAAVFIPVGLAFAQTAGNQTSGVSGEVELEEIVVTGSRLADPSFATPTPVQTLSSATIEERAPAQISDVINQMPQFRVTRSAAGSGRIADQQSGVQALLDLRGLDPVRTLTLINGRRSTGTTQQGTFDTNMIPIGLIDHIDTVTGGASSAYGSDAVAGVVNFVLKNKLEGLNGSVQYGATRYGDGKQYVGTFAGGTSFADGRGHVILGVDSATTKGVGNMYTRPYGRNEPALIAISAAQRAALGLPAQYFTNGAELAATPGSLITTQASNGNFYALDAAGNPYQQTTFLGSGTSMATNGNSRNYGYAPAGAFQLQNRNERQAAYSRVEFEVAPDVTLFTELNYGRTRLPPQLTAFYTVNYSLPRASVPTAIAALYPTSATTLSFSRIITEGDGGNQTWQTNALKRGVVGAEGKFLDNWNWDVSYEYSRTHQNFNTSGLVTSAFNKAIAGCAGATLLYEQLSGKSCVAFNPLGVQNNPAAADYFFTDQHQDSFFGQDSVAANISGSPVTLWAGDLSLAAGLEWRHDTLKVVGNALGIAGLFSQGNFGSYAGNNSVKEGYVEFGLPLVKDVPGVKGLDLNGALRRTDYKLSGAVTTWKGGFTYDVVEGARLRFTKSRDIRAPNLNELFFIGGALPGTQTLTLPSGAQVTNSNVNVNGQGNPNLVPEKADTITAGIVLEPTGVLSGLHASFDYYRIKVNGAIVRLSTAQTLAQCTSSLAAGNTTCAGIVFNGNPATVNSMVSLSNVSQNLNALKVEGVDINLGYTVSELPFAMPGKFQVNLLVNRALHDQQVINSVGRVDTFELAGSMNGVPKWSGNLSFDYDLNKFGAEYQLTGFTGVKYDTLTLYPQAGTAQTYTGITVDPSDGGYLNTNNNSININHFGGAVYSNISAHYKITDNVQVFGVVNNLFDRKPPDFAIVAATNGSRNLSYDLLGLAYKAGVRVNF